MTVSATRYEVGQGHEHINGIVTVREIGWECVLEPMGVHMNTCYRVARSVAERGKAYKKTIKESVFTIDKN